MKKILFFLFIAVSLNSFGQNAFKGATNTYKNKIDYEANLGSTFSPRSIVDKHYIDSARNKARDSVVALIDTTGSKDYTTQVTGKPAHLNARYPSWHIESPTSTDDIFLLKVPYAITITSIDYAVSGSSPSLTFDIVFGSTADAGSPTEVIGTDVTTTSTTGGSTASFADATVPANQWIRLKPSAASGTINRLALVINYTID